MERNNKGQFKKGHGFIDLTGKRYGRLTVIEKDEEKSKRKSYWKCLCDCGNSKSVRSDCLKMGFVKSCGCLKVEQDIKNLSIDLEHHHNMTNHSLFSQWNAMIYRCECENASEYKNYGKRGIKVCDEWHDVKTFINWAESNGYEKGLTIERIDVNGNYEPMNCEFITMRYQAFNKRNTIYGMYNGKQIPISKFAFENGLDYQKVYWDFRKGISLEEMM